MEETPLHILIVLIPDGIRGNQDGFVLLIDQRPVCVRVRLVGSLCVVICELLIVLLFLLQVNH